MSTYQLTYSLPIFFNFSLPELPVKSSQWSPSYMVSKCQMDSFADILSQSKKQTQFYCRLSDHNDKIQPNMVGKIQNLKHAGKDCFNI